MTSAVRPHGRADVGVNDIQTEQPWKHRQHFIAAMSQQVNWHRSRQVHRSRHLLSSFSRWLKKSIRPDPAPPFFFFFFKSLLLLKRKRSDLVWLECWITKKGTFLSKVLHQIQTLRWTSFDKRSKSVHQDYTRSRNIQSIKQQQNKNIHELNKVSCVIMSIQSASNYYNCRIKTKLAWQYNFKKY